MWKKTLAIKEESGQEEHMNDQIITLTSFTLLHI